MDRKKKRAAKEYLQRGLASDACCSFFKSMFMFLLNGFCKKPEAGGYQPA
jgi:hypothetical protein